MRHLSAFAVSAVVALALSFAAAISAHASGTSYVWIGGTGNPVGDNHSWTDQNNWSPQGVPGTGDSVSIDSPSPDDASAHVDNIPTVTLASLSVSENPNRLTVSISGGDLTVTDSFNWNGGTISTPVTLDANASGTISGSNGRLSGLDADMTVNGSLTLSDLTDPVGSADGELKINDPQVLHIAPGATLTSSGANVITFAACCVTPAKVVNDGTIEVNGGDLEIAAVEFDQHGTVSAVSGARVVTDRAPVTAANGASYTGTGGWFMTNGAAAVFSGTQNLGADFHLELGGINVNAGAQLGGTATFAGTGTIDWTGATIEGNFTFGHGVHVNVSGVHTNSGQRVLSGSDNLSGAVAATVTNHGTMVFDEGATVSTTTHAKLVNATDGTLSIAPGVLIASMGCCTNPDQLVNNGSLTVPTGTTTDPAELQFIGYKSSNATTSVAAGRELLIDGGASGLLSDATLTGGGTVAIATPMTVHGAEHVQGSTTLALNLHGSLNGTATVGGPGSLSWTGGAFSGAVTVSVGGGTRVTGTDLKMVANINGGSTPSKLTFTTPLTVAPGTSAQHDVISIGSSTMNTRTATFGNFVDLAGGKLVNAGSMKVTGALERGGTTVNGGTLTLTSAATLHDIGAFNQSAGGTLAVNIAATTHGLLSVQGPVALHGTLAAHDDGSYNPAVGKKVQVVASSNITASPPCVVTSGAGSSSRHWAASTNTSGLVLTRRSGVHRHC